MSVRINHPADCKSAVRQGETLRYEETPTARQGRNQKQQVVTAEYVKYAKDRSPALRCGGGPR